MNGGAPLEVLSLSAVDATAWSTLLAATSGATPFHTLGYARAVAALPGWTVSALVARSAGGARYAAGLLVAARRLGPLRALSSMAFGGYGGPVVDDSVPVAEGRLLAARLVGAAHRLAGRLGSLEIVDFHGTLDPLPGAVVTPLVTRVLALDAPYAALLQRFEPKVRHQIRQAERLGVSIREAGDERDLAAFLRLARGAYEKRGSLPPPDAFFAGAWREMAREGGARLTLAVLPDGQVAGAALHVVGGRHTFNLMIGIDSSLAAARPANLLVADAIRHSVAIGCTLHNMGLTPAGAPGVDAFKKAWGTRLAPYRAFSLGSPVHRLGRAALRLARGRPRFPRRPGASRGA